MVFIYLVILTVTLIFIHYVVKFSYFKRKGIKGPTPLPLFGIHIKIKKVDFFPKFSIFKQVTH